MQIKVAFLSRTSVTYNAVSTPLIIGSMIEKHATISPLVTGASWYTLPTRVRLMFSATFPVPSY